MTVLTNLYFHIDVNLNKVDIRETEIYFEEVARDYSTRIFRQDVEVKVYVVDGSIKATIFITGALYLAIGQYGSFRAGVDQIIDDSKLLQQLVISNMYKEGVTEDAIIEKKRLLSTPDKIRRLYLRIDRFEMNQKTLSSSDKKKELSNIKKYIATNIQDMDAKQDIEILESEISDKYFPEPSRLPDYKTVSMPYIKDEKELSVFSKPLKLSHDKKR